MTTTDFEPRQLDISKVHPNPDQPRQYFDQTALEELAESIKEHGLNSPILVRPVGDDSYQIVHGERRYRAHKLLERTTIRAEVKELTDHEAYVLSFVENEQREDITPVEIARALQRMIEAEDLTQAAVAKRISKSRTWVAQKLRLLNLSSEVQNFVKTDDLTEGHARQLLKLQTANLNGKVEEIARQAVNNDWSVARLQSEVDVTIAGLPDIQKDVSQDTQVESPRLNQIQAIWEAAGPTERLEITVWFSGLPNIQKDVSQDTGEAIQ